MKEVTIAQRERVLIFALLLRSEDGEPLPLGRVVALLPHAISNVSPE